jgi:nucleoside-diphosphate-sugar epimerase
MRVLVTGGAGYIGSTLVPVLLQQGYEVRVVDIGLFGVSHLPKEAEVIVADVVNFDETWLDGVDAVIHLAGISNDPMAEFSPVLNYTVNAAGAAILAHAAKKEGIRRFVFASTCSVYGFTDNRELAEEAAVSPSFPYAVSKLMAERALTCLTDDDFRPIILRKGTVVGWSPRMRYDLVVNTMVKTALVNGRIVVHNASLCRPLLDVRDAAAAYLKALSAQPSLTGIFNIAHDNYTIGRLAEEVAAALRECDINVSIETQSRWDLRNYRVSLQKAQELLGFRATISMNQCVKDIVERVHFGQNADFDNPLYMNVEWMKLTMAEKQAALVLD